MLVKPRIHCIAGRWDLYGRSGISKFQRINANSIENVADETLFTFEKSLAAVKMHRLYVTKCKYRSHVIHLATRFFPRYNAKM